MDQQLIKKLLLKPGMVGAIVNSPGNFLNEFRELASENDIQEKVSSGSNWVLIFVKSREDVDGVGVRSLQEVNPDVIFWFAYPKKSSGIETDVTRDNGWQALDELGWKGVSMISINDTWSAFRVRPAEQTPANPDYPTSNEAVAKKTGKNWVMWFRILDEAVGRDQSHQEIVNFLGQKHKLDGWWCQMIANAYEQHIGRRKKHEMAGGFEISVSKTLPVPIEELYLAFYDANMRSKWLEDSDIGYSTANENKNLRGPWVDGKTRISIDFYAKGVDKTQVVVQHLKLENAEEGEKMKTYWKEALDALVLFFSV